MRVTPVHIQALCLRYRRLAGELAYYQRTQQPERAESLADTVDTLGEALRICAPELALWGLEVHGTDGANSLSGLSGWVNHLYGEGGNDSLTGGQQNDWLFGGRGNDTLGGGSGDDTYTWTPGDGLDTVYEHYGAGQDTLAFQGVAAGDAQFWRTGNDLLIEIGGPSEGVLVKNQFTAGNGIETFRFGETVYTGAEVNNFALFK